MREFFRSSAQGDDDLLGALKNNLIDDVWIALIFLAPLGAMIGVYRAIYSGLTYTLLIQSSLIAFVSIFFFARNRFSRPAQAAVAVGFLFACGMPAIIQYGFHSAAFVWFFFATLIVAYCFPKKVVYLVMATTAAIMLATVLFVSGQQALPIDANEFIYQLAGWGPTVFATLFFGVLMIKVIHAHNLRCYELNAKLSEQKQVIEQLANHDSLTGLPNRRLAVDRLEVAIEIAKRENDKLALLFIDLDDFKPVNDNFGHEIGDQVLKTVAKRLKANVRKSDSVCRIGGDEFIAIMPGIKSKDAMELVCKKLIAAISEPIVINGQSIIIGASIGVSVYPTDADNEVDLQHAADEAMYRAKHSGKNQFAIADAGQ
ncbi:GGDEF domain-containing protein [Neiella sp. HB171785]|uniref:GGDEF domain-containing protein n=1 Tax=Neiella litorisoli TaxID=2771431 RepID=A0A8J6QSW0_9GAMM|nr:GGDEF domain-containing protein [Neiella litorisoli]MBD1390229.1 GGDEF domain-containing protein [Neiella litorisoli]